MDLYLDERDRAEGLWRSCKLACKKLLTCA